MQSLQASAFHGMRVPFPDRSQAGAALAHILSDYADRDDVTVVGIARGGVPVAAAVAEFLHATLTVMAVEKVRLFNGMVCGAVADPEGPELLLSDIRTSKAAIDKAVDAARREAARRATIYNTPPGNLAARRVLIVDDGIESAATVQAAIAAVKRLGAAHVVVATPVAMESAARQLRDLCDDVVCLAMPKPFHNVGECYLDYTRITDEECARIVSRKH